MAVTDRMIGKDLCEALGLDPSKTMSITIKVESQSVVTVESVQYPSEEDTGRFIEVLKRYRIDMREDYGQSNDHSDG